MRHFKITLNLIKPGDRQGLTMLASVAESTLDAGDLERVLFAVEMKVNNITPELPPMRCHIEEMAETEETS